MTTKENAPGREREIIEKLDKIIYLLECIAHIRDIPRKKTRYSLNDICGQQSEIANEDITIPYP